MLDATTVTVQSMRCRPSTRWTNNHMMEAPPIDFNPWDGTAQGWRFGMRGPAGRSYLVADSAAQATAQPTTGASRSRHRAQPGRRQSHSRRSRLPSTRTAQASALASRRAPPVSAAVPFIRPRPVAVSAVPAMKALAAPLDRHWDGASVGTVWVLGPYWRMMMRWLSLSKGGK